MSFLSSFDAALDLRLERTVEVPPELIWKAWTTPELLMPWFCPRPWLTVECDIDLQPGGAFRTVMQSPEGEKFENLGCFLEIIAMKRLIWTDALLPGFRPQEGALSSAGLRLTAGIFLEASGTGTKYTAMAKHQNQVDRQRHVDMGFHSGWSTVLDQLIETLRNSPKI